MTASTNGRIGCWCDEEKFCKNEISSYLVEIFAVLKGGETNDKLREVGKNDQLGKRMVD